MSGRAYCLLTVTNTNPAAKFSSAIVAFAVDTFKALRAMNVLSNPAEARIIAAVPHMFPEANLPAKEIERLVAWGISNMSRDA